MKKPPLARTPAELRTLAARLHSQAKLRLQRANDLMAERHLLLAEAESYEALARIQEAIAARNEVAHG